jgi:hypothetical protein
MDTGKKLSPKTRAMLEGTDEQKTLHDEADSVSREPGMGVGMPLPTPLIPENNDRSSEEKTKLEEGNSSLPI